MACGLKDDELEVLNALYRHHCFNDKASYNLKQIAQAFRRKFGRDPRDVAKDLEKMGYIKSKPKKDMKYWIDDMGLACYALNQHGYNAIDDRVPQGRIHHL